MTKRLKVDIDVINTRANENLYKLVERGETTYADEVADIAKFVKTNGKKIVLMAGPSSSGKTTSSYKLQGALKTIGVKAVIITMDEFFVDVRTLPLRDDGKPDIENLVALDVETIRKCLIDILEKGETMTPQFDFITHSRKKEWLPLKLKSDEVIIMEGIHALNPVIIEGLPIDKICRIYIHCNSDFVFGGKTLFHARQLRLLRRIVRDERERGTSVEETLNQWDEVCKGEDRNIRPFKDTADFHLNTTHFYEPLLYKSILAEKFEGLKSTVPEAKMFLEKFKYCSCLPKEFVPKDSLIREFIGK